MTDAKPSPGPKPRLALKGAKGSTSVPAKRGKVDARVSAAISPVQAPPAGESRMMSIESLEAAVPPVDSFAADATTGAGFGPDQVNEKVREMMEKSMKTMTEVSDFAKGNVEAIIESAKVAAAGAETLTTNLVESSKKSFEEAQAVFKTMATVKSPTEFFQLQNDFAKSQFDKAVTNWSQMSEAWLKLSGEIMQPLSTRMALAAENVKKTMTV